MTVTHQNRTRILPQNRNKVWHCSSVRYSAKFHYTEFCFWDFIHLNECCSDDCQSAKCHSALQYSVVCSSEEPQYANCNSNATDFNSA